MAESTLSVDYDAIRREFGLRMRIGRDPDGWKPDDADDVAAMIRDGLNNFYAAHEWSFMRPEGTLSTEDEYNTGTVTVASGVVTGVGTVFPANSAEFDFEIDQSTYDVSTRDSDTQLTLVDTTVTAAAGSGYNLARSKYEFDDDFGALDSPITYRPGQASWYTPLPIVSKHEINRRRQAYTVNSHPQMCSLLTKEYDATTGTRTYIRFWPSPDAVYKFYFFYKAHPNTLDATNKYPLGGREHAVTILAACLAQTEEKGFELGTEMREQYSQHLAQSISRDRNNITPDSLGFNMDSRNQRGSNDGAERTRLGRGHSTYDGHTLFIP